MGSLVFEKLPTLFVIVGLLMLGLTGCFVFGYNRLKRNRLQNENDPVHSQKMIEAQIESQEIERKRIAADLHDSLGPLLWGAKLNASFLERSVPYNEEQLQSYKELIDALDESLRLVKRIAWELTPEAFQQTGFSESIRHLCYRLDGKGMSVAFKENTSYMWNDTRALSTYRIVQELISNCLKHSHASFVHIQVTWYHPTVEIVVQDNGVGFKLRKDRSGVGWWNIQKRSQQLNAKIEIGNPPIEKGTSVRVVVPLLL
jgi:signal transduction histidine kinase